MEKEYETFVEELREAVIAAMGLKATQVCFEKQGGKYTAEGDRLFIECAVLEDSREVCSIFTRELYERYKEKNTIDYIVEEIVCEVEKVKSAGIFRRVRNIRDYTRAKKDLFIRLINFDRNEKNLQDAVYRRIGDIAMVLYMRVGEAEGCITSIKVRMEHVEGWKLDSDKVFKEALLNTYRMSPPRIYQWEKLVFNPDYQGEDFMDVFCKYKMSKSAIGNCLSTTKRTNGAVAIFLPGVAARIGELMGGDYYLVFTSVHEVMIHNDQRVYPEDLEEVLADTIRDATPKEDYLTASIYHYNCQSGIFSRICN